MTPLQAIEQAQQTGQIAITQPTANILAAMAAFDSAAADLVNAMQDNLPSEIGDNETQNMIAHGFFEVISPVQEYVYKTVGNIMFQGVFHFQGLNEFDGL